MNWNPDDDQEHVDRRLLGMDATNNPDWRRRAVGTTRQAALAELTRTTAVIQTMLPIEPMRILQRHIADRDINQSVWLRQAIAQHFINQGGNPDVAEQLLAMKTERRRDVPRDPRGQNRRRTGRNGFKRL